MTAKKTPQKPGKQQSKPVPSKPVPVKPVAKPQSPAKTAPAKPALPAKPTFTKPVIGSGTGFKPPVMQQPRSKAIKPLPKAPPAKAPPKPAKPAAPAKPVAPVKTPAKPVAPAKPAAPAKPSAPAKPAKPSAPAKQGKTPSKTQKEALPAKPSFTAEEMKWFRGALLSLHRQLVSRVNQQLGDALPVVDKINIEEDGTEAFDRVVGLEQAGKDQALINKVIEALRALDNGTYGFCQMCNCKITTVRLKALPFAFTCVDCQNKIDNPGGEKKRFVDLLD